MINIRLLAIMIFVASPAAAERIPFGGGEIFQVIGLTAETTFQNSPIRLNDFDSATFNLPGDPVFAEALIQGPDPAFSSAFTDANGNLEVGVSSRRGGSTDSVSNFQLFMSNQSPTPANLAFSFTIAAGEISLTDFSVPGFTPLDGPRGRVLVTIEYILGNGPLETIFEFGSDMRVNGGVIALTTSGPAITTASSPPNGGEHIVTIAEFDHTIVFPAMAPGEDLQVIYTMTASGSLGDRPGFFGGEWGYSANIGDPLDLTFSGSVGMVYSPAPIPEPASWLLFGLGLPAVAALRRRQLRKAQRVTTPICP